MPDPLSTLLTELNHLARHDSTDARVRLAVRLHARAACEYCLLPTIGQFHVEHIIPPGQWQAHLNNPAPALAPPTDRQGPDHLDNYAWSCPFCNLSKGQRVQQRVGRQTFRLFDPRHDRWTEHFVLARRGLFIVGVTGIGRATERALGFNDSRIDGPLGTRAEAIFDGDYPPPWMRASGMSADA